MKLIRQMAEDEFSYLATYVIVWYPLFYGMLKEDCLSAIYC